MSRSRHARCLEDMTDDRQHTTKVVVIGGGYAGTAGGQPSAVRADVDITLVNPRRNSSSGSGCTSSWRAPTTRRSTTARCSATASGWSWTARHASTPPPHGAAGVGTRAELRLPHLRGRQHGHDAVVGARRDRIRLSDRGTRACAAAARQPGRAAARMRRSPSSAPDRPARRRPRSWPSTGRKVTLVCGGRLAPSFSEPGRRSVAKRLDKLGVTVIEADVVVEVRPDAVVLADGAVRPSAVTIWTAGFGVPDLAASSGLRTDALGRLLTDETLTSVDDDTHRRGRRCGGTVGHAAADELPGRRTARRSGRQHGAEPHRRNQAGRHRPGVHGIEHQPGPARGHASMGAQGRQFAELLHRRAHWRGDQGGGLQEPPCGGSGARRASPDRSSGLKGGKRPEQPVFEVVTNP